MTKAGMISASFSTSVYGTGLPAHRPPTRADAERAMTRTLWKQVLQASGVFGDKSGWGGIAADAFSGAIADAISRDGPTLMPGATGSADGATGPAGSQSEARFALPAPRSTGPAPDLHLHLKEGPHPPEAKAQLLALVDGPAHISSDYGPRVDPLGHTHRHHDGVDIAAPEGTAIRSAGDGVVTWVGPRGGYGNLVEVTHPDGRRTRYAHTSRIHVQKGQQIQAGDVIAEVGQTGRSTGPHLHFEVRGPKGAGRHAAPVDPAAINLDRALKTYGRRVDSQEEHRLFRSGEPHG